MFAHFLTPSSKGIDKWIHYFSVYERYLASYVNKSVLIFEIGVQNGGSTQLLKKYLGPHAIIVGIDIDPSTKQHEDEQCKIRIGSQSDINFLKSIIREFGTPDIVIDDGSHIMDDMSSSFQFLYPLLNNNGTYMVEDTHTCYWESFGGGLNNENSFMEKTKKLIDKLHFYHYSDKDEDADDFIKSTYSISFYDSMIVFEKKLHPRPIRRQVNNGIQRISLAHSRR